jgi:hypothetical protein
MSTPQSPALNGQVGNSDKLKKDLAELGVFDGQMSLYLLYKLREYGVMGFSGFEGRHYSQFDSLQEDLGRATDLQLLINALAYKYLATGALTHAEIPDDPTLESERRQIFFAAAIGNPTFFVRRDTANRFLQRIIEKTREVRPSRRYPGYLRVKVGEYRLALLHLLREDAADLIESLGLEETIADLEQRLIDPEHRSAVGKLTKGILCELNAGSPMRVTADDFNRGAERYYREGLCRRHMEEGIAILEQDLRELDRAAGEGGELERATLHALGEAGGAAVYLAGIKGALLDERLDAGNLRRLMNLILLTLSRDQEAAQELLERRNKDADHTSAAPVYRAG